MHDPVTLGMEKRQRTSNHLEAKPTRSNQRQQVQNAVQNNHIDTLLCSSFALIL